MLLHDTRYNHTGIIYSIIECYRPHQVETLTYLREYY